MKTITKNLKHIITTTSFVLVMLISFSAFAQQKNLSDKDVEYVKSEFRKGMTSFVESIKPIYKSGMSYSAFKGSLLGESSTAITNEGDALLLKAYNYISKSAPSGYILKYESGKELAAAFRFVKLYNVENKSEKGDLILFGNTTGDTFQSEVILNGEGDCRWYQIGCHLVSIWDWLTSDPDGDGNTPLSDLLDAIATLCQILGC